MILVKVILNLYKQTDGYDSQVGPANEKAKILKGANRNAISTNFQWVRSGSSY